MPPAEVVGHLEKDRAAGGVRARRKDAMAVGGEAPLQVTGEMVWLAEAVAT